AHYFGAWVFIAGFIAHIVLKVPTAIASLRTRRAPGHASQTDSSADRHERDESTAPVPQEPTISRRGALALVGGGSVLVVALSVGQVIGGITRQTSILLPRGRDAGSGPNGFHVNRTAAAARIDPQHTGGSW